MKIADAMETVNNIAMSLGKFDDSTRYQQCSDIYFALKKLSEGVVVIRDIDEDW